MAKNKKYRFVHAVVIILNFFILSYFYQKLKFITGLIIVFIVELVLQAIEKLFFNAEDNEIK